MLSIMDYRCVIALHEELNFARAAEVVGISQPALTGRLRRIEEHLGVRLFTRGRQGADPTRAGHAFAQVSRDIVQMAERGAQAARDADRGVGQALRLGMTQIAAVQIAVPILAAFRRENPTTRIRLSEGTTAALELQVEQNRIDLAFLHPPVHQAGLSERLLMSEQAVRQDTGPYDGASPPAIRYIRKEAPVVVAEIDRLHPEPDDLIPLAEVNTVLGAAVLSEAGYGPFFAPRGWPNPFGSCQVPSTVETAGVALGTSVVWRSLDRRPVVGALLDACRRFRDDAGGPLATTWEAG